MFKNLLKVAIRSIRHDGVYSFLNVLGLTLGITCCLLLCLYIFDELSFDKFHQKQERIYRLNTTFTESGKETIYSTTQAPLAVELQNKYAEVENSVRLIGVGRELFVISDTDKRFYEEAFFFADPSVFDIFSFGLVSGASSKLLDEPNTAVLTESTAKRYFLNDNPLGKSIQNKGQTYKVVGVMKDTPSNSHIRFDALLSMKSFADPLMAWDNWLPHTYVLIRNDGSKTGLENALKSINEQHVRPIFSKLGIETRYTAQPLADIHLKSNFGTSSDQEGDIAYIYVFSAIAFFVLLIAAINYINLATARANRRAKEIGVRKTMGSTRQDIILQFMAESFLTTAIALLLSTVALIALLPLFNHVSGKSITIMMLIKPEIVIGVMIIGVITATAGGAYPAFYLSHFNPALVLKGNISRGTANARLRKVLVIVQFAISISMVICTSVVYDQLQFLRNKDLGFTQENVVTLSMPDQETQARSRVLENRLKQFPNVSETSTSSALPGKELYYSVMSVESSAGRVSKGLDFCFAGYGFLETLNIPLKSGRSFSRQFQADSMGVLVNEQMAKSLGWPDPLGKKISFDDSNPATVDQQYTIIGVIKDYHHYSLHSVIKPLAIFFKEKNYYFGIKIKGQNISETISDITAAWNEVNPGKPFSYTFLDENFQSQYRTDERRGLIFSFFSIISVLISCVGLFGLASFTVEQRAKEMSVRKVVGASVSNIAGLVYRDFLILIGIALAFSVPISYLFMRNWLETFAYQADIKVITFLLSALATIIVTMVSVSFHTIKSARTNPVKVLRGN